MLKKMMEKLAETKKNFEENHGIIAYAVEFITSVALTFGSSYVAAKLTRKAVNKIAQKWKVGKAGSFILSVLVGFIPAFVGSFISTITMPSERVLKVGIINREREKSLLRDISDDEIYADEIGCTIEREEA